ncbi:MAG: hypothetical protein KF902_07640 [Phycisphaeraceae bacterium]|nr:hypothetical protein [Phycisphaeraceae bacterium]MCW5767108.1 hypothetical protein [Phycisphaeraceae bacterium]
MAVSGNKGGKSGAQRTNTTSASGQKTRTAATPSGRGSRVEPSHLTEKAREVRVQKAATKKTGVIKKAAPKKAAKK